VIAFIEQLDPRPVDLMGHSRGGHISFRVAQARPELVRRLVLAEPGGDLDVSLDPGARPGAPSALSLRVGKSSAMVKGGDIEGALENFVDGIDGDGAWRRLPSAAKQQLRDNVFTLIGQLHENRKPYSKADARAIQAPTLFIGGADTSGYLPGITRALAPEVPNAKAVLIPGTRHWMFEQAPEEYCRVVMEFLAG
jgi:pimeloyl-ACP methyl ester carboxylesterase